MAAKLEEFDEENWGPLNDVPGVPDMRRIPVPMPKDLHVDSAVLVSGFASAVAKKLEDAQKKYGYTNGWKDPAWMDECRKELLSHLYKGDPLDVAAYAAFLWHHGQPTFIKENY